MTTNAKHDFYLTDDYNTGISVRCGRYTKNQILSFMRMMSRIKEIPENTCLRGACIFFDTHHCAQMYFGNDGPYFHDKTQYTPIECMITTRNKCNGNCIENIVYGKCPDTFVRDTIGKKLLSHAYTNEHQR